MGTMDYHVERMYARMCINYPPTPGYVSKLTLYTSTSILESVLEIPASFLITSASLLLMWGRMLLIVGKDKTLQSEIQK